MGKYNKTNDSDVPESGIVNIEQMAPEIRRYAINPGTALALLANTPALALSINLLRRSASIVNTHASEPVFVFWGEVKSAVTGGGILLEPAGGSVVFGLNTDIPYTGPVSVISVNASSIGITEL